MLETAFYVCSWFPFVNMQKCKHIPIDTGNIQEFLEV